jgi:translation initiation factor 1 (eIF-1/SUI1)
MGKKPSPPSKSVPLGERQKLTHNPFASLASGGRGPNATTEAAPEAPGPADVAAAAPRRGRLVLARETKHRGGKAVVVIRGFDKLQAWDLAATEGLAKELKQALGCGGTVEHYGAIIIQGDRPAQVAAWLREQGFRVEGVTT